MPLSLYIPCYNVEDHIAACIEGVLAQTVPVDEILVIDDGCCDRTLEIAAQYPVRIIRHDTNKGLAAARNTAFQAAQHELVAALDADCVPDPQWLERLLPLLANAQVAIVGGQLIETVLESLADRWRQAHMTQSWGEQTLTNPPFMFGNNTIVRKALVAQVGGYDEQLRTNGEDADLSRRLIAAGYTAIYEPGAIVSHRRRDTVRSILETCWRYWRFGTRAYFEDVRLKPFLRHQYQHFAKDFAEVFARDWQNHNYELLGVDLLLPFYMVYRDFQTIRAKRRSSSQSALETVT